MRHSLIVYLPVLQFAHCRHYLVAFCCDVLDDRFLCNFILSSVRISLCYYTHAPVVVRVLANLIGLSCVVQDGDTCGHLHTSFTLVIVVFCLDLCLHNIQLILDIVQVLIMFLPLNIINAVNLHNFLPLLLVLCIIFHVHVYFYPISF